MGYEKRPSVPNRSFGPNELLEQPEQLRQAALDVEKH